MALELASQKDNSAIVWLHGPQRFILGNIDAVTQKLARLRHVPSLYMLQSAPGLDLISESLNGYPGVETRPTTLNFKRNCIMLLDELSGKAKIYNYQRERIASGSFLPGPYSVETSAHLARLWARDRVDEIRRTYSPETQREAAKLATTFKLVTAVSGAVVLENDQQYRDAGLEPPQSGMVPTVPEPETWILLCIAAILLGCLYRRANLTAKATC
jgi:hypothetical protein